MENYFNYFTEIENCFRQQRGTPLLLSAVDWALIESWKEAGIPLEAVLTGIERTFEKRARRPRRFTKINGLAFCSQEVMIAADAAATATLERGEPRHGDQRNEAPFAPGQVAYFLEQCAAALERAAERAQLDASPVVADDLHGNAQALHEVAAKNGGGLLDDLEAIERTLTAIEDRVSASLARAAPVDLLVALHADVDRSLASCRRAMTSAQIDQVQRQFLKKRIFEHYQLPRMSLFYMQ